MELINSQRIQATRDQVWAALNDPDTIKRCIPGCQSLEQGDDGMLAAVVVLKIGPVKATFHGKVRFENIEAPAHLTLVGEGSGGIAGHARGSAEVTLQQDGEATLLSYNATAQVGGKIAQLGARLIQSTSQKLAAEFFSQFQKEVVAVSAILPIE